MYRENESALLSIKGLRFFMYCELISALVVLLIDIPSCHLDLTINPSGVYYMHDLNR